MDKEQYRVYQYTLETKRGVTIDKSNSILRYLKLIAEQIGLLVSHKEKEKEEDKDNGIQAYGN